MYIAWKYLREIIFNNSQAEIMRNIFERIIEEG